MLDGDDLRLEGGERRSLEAGRHADEEDDRQDAGQADVLGVQRQEGEGHGADHEGHAGEEDDGAAVAPVGDVPAEEHEAEGRDGLHEAEQPERERLAGDLVGLEGHDRGDGRHAQRRQAAGRRAAHGTPAAAAARSLATWETRSPGEGTRGRVAFIL